MSEKDSKQTVQDPPKKKAEKPLSRGQRIHRRRTLALQRRTDKAQAVTLRD